MGDRFELLQDYYLMVKNLVTSLNVKENLSTAEQGVVESVQVLDQFARRQVLSLKTFSC